METPQEEYYVAECDGPGEHPSTLGIINSDVFYSFEEACEVMRQVRAISKIMTVQSKMCYCFIWGKSVVKRCHPVAHKSMTTFSNTPQRL